LGLRGCFKSSIPEARLGKVQAVVLEVLASPGEPAALEVRDSVGELVLHVRARNTVLVVFHVGITEEVAHVTHISAARVVAVGLGNRASVDFAASSIVIEVESDEILVLVVPSPSLSLNKVAVGGEKLVVSTVMRINPLSTIRCGASPSLDFRRNLRATVREVHSHLGHRVVAVLGARAG